jgi:hypothetical protein
MPSTRATAFRSALATLGCALSLAFVQAPAAHAADASLKAPSLPLTSSFAKAADSENGPYVLSLTNTSGSSIKVSVKILLSVYFHADSKSRNIPEHSIDAGQVWTIPGLAAADKVIVTATGYAPLELTVP